MTRRPGSAGRTRGSVGIIGAGIFGVSAALQLSALGLEVTLYEQRADILEGSTARNLFRLHRGYHYPRDPSTARQAREGYNSFSRSYREAVVKTAPHHYAIAAEGSRTSAEQFETHCDELGLRARRVQLPMLRFDSVQACFEVDESYYDPTRLRELSWERLVRSNVRVHLNCICTAQAIGKEHDVLVVAAYGALNQLLADLDCPTFELQYEVCEVPILKVPNLPRCSVVVMDGPFMSIAPYSHDLHLLYDVVHSVRRRAVGHANPHVRGSAGQFGEPHVSPQDSSNLASIVSSGRRFIGPLATVRHAGSMFAERVVLPDVRETDARPTLIRWVSPRVLSILSGKVSTSVDAGQSIAAAVAEKLGLPATNPDGVHNC